jgi:hypothetical protein
VLAGRHPWLLQAWRRLHDQPRRQRRWDRRERGWAAQYPLRVDSAWGVGLQRRRRI